MKKFITASLLPIGALMAFSAPAQAAPQDDSSQGQSAASVINQLKSQGIDVHVNKIGSGPMNQCTVANISKAVTQPPTIPVFNWRDATVFTHYPQPVVTVTLNCAK